MNSLDLLYAHISWDFIELKRRRKKVDFSFSYFLNSFDIYPKFFSSDFRIENDWFLSVFILNFIRKERVSND